MTVPTLIFCGERDPNFSGAEHAGRVLPNATFVPMAGFGHELGFYSELLLPLVTDFLERMRGDGQARA